jgi:hypothetical protein
VGLVHGYIICPRPAGNDDVFQWDLPRLVVSEADCKHLSPARETSNQGSLEEQVFVRRIIPVQTAQSSGGLTEEFLLELASRTVGILPPMKGLEDLQQTVPAFPIDSGLIQK